MASCRDRSLMLEYYESLFTSRLSGLRMDASTHVKILRTFFPHVLQVRAVLELSELISYPIQQRLGDGRPGHRIHCNPDIYQFSCSSRLLDHKPGSRYGMPVLSLTDSARPSHCESPACAGAESERSGSDHDGHTTLARLSPTADRESGRFQRRGHFQALCPKLVGLH
jgi:hypothetical protein